MTTKSCFLFLEKVFTIVSLFNYTGGILPLILSGGASEGDNAVGTPDFALIQLLFFLNYLVSFFLLALRWKTVIKIISKDRNILVILGLCALSFTWSAQPQVTLVRTVAIIGSSLFGIYLATRYTLKEQIQLLTLMFGISIIISLLLAVGLPKYGIMSGLHAGKWRGIYSHKNVLGKSMILSGCIFLINAIDADKNKIRLWAGFIFSIILIILCKSSSSLINFITIIMIFFSLYSLRLRYEILFPVVFLLIIVGEVSYLWLVENTERILNSMGKDASLTGRGPLWSAVLDMIWKRPLLGYGFSGFWGGWDRPCAYVWRLTGWAPPNAHNGFLDLWVDLGLLGLSTYLVGFFTNFLKGLAFIRMNRTAVSFWPVIYMIYFWLSNQTESSLVKQNEIYWVLYVTISLSMLIRPDNLQNQKLHSEKVVIN